MRNWPAVQELLLEHLYLAVVPTVVGVAVALPIGLLLRDRRRARSIAVVLSSMVFTIPSLALFVVLPVILGTRVLDPINVVIALTLYTVALSVRTTFEALDAVPAATREAATAIGYSSWKRALAVDLPLAIPVLTAGTRVVAVTNVSMVSVGAVIGIGGLGQLFTTGYQRDFPEQILTGLVLILLLAIVFDRIIALIGRAFTPWIRGASLKASERRLRALAQALPEVGRLREVVGRVR
ncbi:ABC transporter permease [Serinibacter arcticus]|uniref:ABC transporter permease n=1 Tax=Serinibacter arcticus TaxID=1655435 RepID=A0A2U1ZZM1_9MICO|nr:ABC transporter permease [Serinibacter arcticus]